MNNLPEHRRALAGRTWPSAWSPAAFDPIERPTSADHGHAVAAWLCVALLAAILGYGAWNWGTL